MAQRKTARRRTTKREKQDLKTVAAMAKATTKILQLEAELKQVNDALMASRTKQCAQIEDLTALTDRERKTFMETQRRSRFDALEHSLILARARDMASDVTFGRKAVILAPIGYHERAELHAQLEDAGLFNDLPERFERHIKNLLERAEKATHQTPGFTAGAGAIVGGAMKAPTK